MAKTYTTVQGDAWDYIALKTMGSEKYMDKLLAVNPEHQHLIIFPANILLTIPDVPVKSSSTLPPWKRGITNATS